MPRQDLEYPKEPFSTVKRKGHRGRYELETIHQIINSCPLLHVSFAAPGSPFPAILPMIGQMGSFERPSADLGDVLDLYLHGYVSSRIVNLSRDPADANTNEKGLPVSVAATHLDGLVLALTPMHHSYNYRSAVLFGHAEVVTDTAEKLYAMELVTDSVVPGRWAATRVPPTPAEMQATSVLRVRIAAGSAKIHTGPPGDDRADRDDAALLARVWTGVVPVHATLGAPLPGPYNQLVHVPGYLADYVAESNADAEAYALEALRTVEEKPKTTADDD
ncbi:hypothetical protein B0T26DRAFT_653736 [Lasiosphaeria miniovina]|uniref:Flavin-nucleotide-binding protein n=1 Tax=Lasiosphaeria miniovina TaxID=1954250 RepID=A0AA40A5D1_9PEZI|nr:uncharacterized protein B0T26DRAFT_653736 [Lasiosphaeria miniovina]KAK0709589.1 hypothetical protein B0T26DRAFT_653736 [Lasiosphaeria miniovina]